MKRKILPLFIAISTLIAIIWNLLVYKDEVEYSWDNLTRTTTIETHSTNVMVVTERPSPIALTCNGELILRELSEVVTVVLYPHEGKIDYYIKGKNRYLLIYTDTLSFEKPVEGVQIEGTKVTMKSGSSQAVAEVTFKKSPDTVNKSAILIFFIWLTIASIGGFIVYIYSLNHKEVSTGE